MKTPDANDILCTHGRDALRDMLDVGWETGGGDAEPPKSVLFNPTPFLWRDPAELQPRAWVYGQHYQRKYVSATIGRRGHGKTSRAIVEAISMVIGRDLLAECSDAIPKRRLWYIGEDTRDEIEKRIIAACVHHNVKPGEIADGLFFDSVFDLPRGAVKVATLKGMTVVPNEGAITAIKVGIRRNRIDVLVLDPLRKFHGARESDNDQMDEVMSIFSEIAMEHSVAIELLHHTRKPSGAGNHWLTVDDSRGADAIIAAVRSARIINVLGGKDAASLGVEEADAWRHARIDSGKANMAAPSDAAWTRTASASLPCGESIGVIELWKPCGTWDDVTPADIEHVREAARTGAYRRSSQAGENWIGKVMPNV
jgi:AAA domain-containing protein